MFSTEYMLLCAVLHNARLLQSLGGLKSVYKYFGAEQFDMCVRYCSV